MTRRHDLERDAADVGLLVCTWAPGDGVTRYRFFRRDAVPEGQCYFGPANGIRTVLGIREARNFIAGYKAGKGE